MEICTKYEFNLVVMEHTKLLASATQTLMQFTDNISGLFNDFAQLNQQMEQKRPSAMNEFDYYHKKLAEYIKQVHIEIPALMDVVKESERQLSEHQTKLQQLTESNAKLEKLVMETEQRYNKAISQIENQSTYATAMGSTLAKMLWKTSKSESVIRTYIDTGTLNPFLNLVNSTIVGFQETYHDDMPEPETYEVNFLLSLFGIYTNIVAQDIGREYVLGQEIGVACINKILLYLQEMKMPSAQLLKRLVLMFLYNLSITKQGAEIMENNDQGIDNILTCLDDTHTVDIQSITLSLMISLVKELDSTEFCRKIMNKLSQNENFQKLMNSSDNDLVNLCSQLVKMLQSYE